MKPLVLLHGAPGDGSLWKPVVDALAAEVHVICPTLRWFGPDPWADDGSAFGTAAHTQQLIELLENLSGADAACVVAWSYSTHVLLNALIHRPELVRSAFLYEPGLNTYLTEADDIASFGADAGHAFGPIVQALQMKGPEHAVEALFDSSGGDGYFQTLPRQRREGYLASARMMPLLMGGGQPPANLTADDLSRIKVPVSVAFGQGTRLLFEIASRAVAHAIPAAELLAVEDADHMLPEKDPRHFARLLDAWIDQ